MPGLAAFWSQGDVITRAVAMLLLGMSIVSWATIVWKGWRLGRVRRDLSRAVPAFWRAADLTAGRRCLVALDREGITAALVDAATSPAAVGSLETQADPRAQATRRLRDALHAVVGRLRVGQVLLASVGSTAPFVGLFGTVWGIYHALISISASAGSITIDRVAAPVGEALVMTAAGLGVAIPAVLAYNVFGQRVAGCEAELEGFAHDLRELVEGAGRASAPGAP